MTANPFTATTNFNSMVAIVASTPSQLATSSTDAKTYNVDMIIAVLAVAVHVNCNYSGKFCSIMPLEKKQQMLYTTVLTRIVNTVKSLLSL